MACTPSEVVACRGDQAVRCNAAGNNYDLVQCQLGCDVAAGGCLPCSTNQQCDNPTPVCDGGEHQCRACVRDDECASQACEAGACVAETGVVYAAPGGVATSGCAQGNPCSLDGVIQVASTAAPSPIVRLLPGVYMTGLQVLTGASLTIVATGAVLGASSTLKVKNGADVQIRGIAIRLSGAFIECGGVGMPHGSLSLSDSSVALTNTSSNNINVLNCTVRLSRSHLTLAPASGSVVLGSNDDSTVEADRVLFDLANPQPLDVGQVSIFGKRVSYKITNSVFDRMSITFATSDTTAPGSQLYFVYNTFVFHSDATTGPLQLGPNPASFRDIRFENNIMLTLGGSSDTFFKPDCCTLQNNILFPQTSVVGAGNNIADPQLVDAANGDYHLKPTSPAVNAAMSSVGLTTDHDFEGKPRPQGAQSDIGAFELAP